MHVQVLGDGPGAASAMKMALGGLAKGLCALFAEVALLADRHEMLGQMLDATARIYPGVFEVVERMLPTYTAHARAASDGNGAGRADTASRGHRPGGHGGRPRSSPALGQRRALWPKPSACRGPDQEQGIVASMVRQLSGSGSPLESGQPARPVEVRRNL